MTDYTWDVARSIPQVLQDGDFTYVYGLDLISSSYMYTAFGNVLDHIGDDADPWLFAGEQSDEASGMYYLRARYYDPAIGRFITRDPSGGSSARPGTQSKYPYVINHPTGLTDPSGRQCFGWDWCEERKQEVDEKKDQTLEAAKGGWGVLKAGGDETIGATGDLIESQTYRFEPWEWTGKRLKTMSCLNFMVSTAAAITEAVNPPAGILAGAVAFAFSEYLSAKEGDMASVSLYGFLQFLGNFSVNGYVQEGNIPANQLGKRLRSVGSRAQRFALGVSLVSCIRSAS
jgi:RHS repeat-associated protein